MSVWSRITDALEALRAGEPLSAVFDRLRTTPERSVAFTIGVIALGAKLAKADGTVTRELADHALTRLGVDNLGLDGADRRYLLLIAENYAGGPVGIETMSAALSESRDALEEVIEPFLLQKGLIQRTPRGRMLAQKGWDHLGMVAPKVQGALFE